MSSTIFLPKSACLIVLTEPAIAVWQTGERGIYPVLAVKSCRCPPYCGNANPSAMLGGPQLVGRPILSTSTGTINEGPTTVCLNTNVVTCFVSPLQYCVDLLRFNDRCITLNFLNSSCGLQIPSMLQAAGRIQQCYLWNQISAAVAFVVSSL